MDTKNNKRMRYLVTLIFLLSISYTNGIFSQENTLTRLEFEFGKIDSTIAIRQNQRKELSKQVQYYAREIEQLKEKKRLNYFQHQRLEMLLKDSQDLSKEIEKIDSELRILNKSYGKTGQHLIQFYDSEINKSLSELEEKKISPEYTQKLILEIESLRAKKEEVKHKIGRYEIKEIKLTKIQITQDDSPKQIKLKADLLKDQEDKLRLLSQQIEKRSDELQRELKIRNRIGEFIMDLALFDQQEEALGNFSTSTSRRPLNASDTERGKFSDLRGGALQENLLVGQKDFDYSILSTEQLEEAIENLNTQRLRLQAQADSLAQQAETFYRVAREMKK